MDGSRESGRLNAEKFGAVLDIKQTQRPTSPLSQNVLGGPLDFYMGSNYD